MDEGGALMVAGSIEDAKKGVKPIWNIARAICNLQLHAAVYQCRPAASMVPQHVSRLIVIWH
jgi:hypothetical protein